MEPFQDGLAFFVLGMKRLCFFDVHALPPLGATAKKHDQCLSIFSQVDSINRAPTDLQLTDASKPLDVGGIAHLKPVNSGCHLGRRLRIQAIKPNFIRARSIHMDVFLDANATDHNGNLFVTFRQ
jgi:hypothetical protein